ncbi:MAG: class I SAM-dependent methyltransferase [Bacteriovoracaceae bacterium]|jgi:16S rRNA (guanine1516-N2)-methyltransferase|nr:class I SAM-dependent methyltransferase [Bacteriovoracaceae bacterium]
MDQNLKKYLPPGLLLCEEKGVLKLCVQKDCPEFVGENFSPLWLDFVGQWKYHQSSLKAKTKEPLFKAIAGKLKKNTEVLDATCGLGGDSLLMLFLGFRVCSIERNPVVFSLLENAKKRALEHGDNSLVQAMGNWQIFLGEACEYFEKEGVGEGVIFLDPMYPEQKRKKALSSKEMRMLKYLLGESSDDQKLVQYFLRMSGKKLVVKRPLKGERVIDGVDHSVSGKSTRYDIYFAR